jgi:O-antigen ligase
MKYIVSSIIIFLLSILFFVLGYREKILPSIFFDLNLVSISLVTIGYVFKNPNKKLYTYFYLLFITIIISFSTFQNIIDFPTNTIINRNSIRFFHYGTILGLIFLARRFPDSIILYTGYVFIIHTNYFQVSEAKGIYLIPLAVLAILNSESEFSKIQNKLFFIFSVYIISILFLYDYNRNQEIVLVLYLVLSVLFVLIVNLLKEIEKKILLKILFFQYLVQFTFFIFYIVIQWKTTSVFPTFPLVFLYFPTSLLAIYSLLAILTSVYNLIQDENIYFKILSIYLLIIASVMLYISHSITSILSLSLGMIFLFLMQDFIIKYYYKNRFIFYFLSTSIIILAGGMIFIVFSNETKLNSFIVRIDIWKYYLSMTFQNHPFIGFGSIPEWKLFYEKPEENLLKNIQQIVNYIDSFESFPPAHSFYIEWYASFGLLGFFILLYNSFYYFTEIIKKIKNGVFNLSQNHKFAITTLIIFSIHGISDFHLLENQVTIAFIFILSFIYDAEEYSTVKTFSINKVFIFIFLLLSLWITIQSIELVRFRRLISKNYTFHNLKIIESKYGDKKLSIKNLRESDFIPFYPKDINYEVWKIVTLIDSDNLTPEKRNHLDNLLSSCFKNFSNHPFCIQSSIQYSKKINDSNNLNLYKDILENYDYFHGKKY